MGINDSMDPQSCIKKLPKLFSKLMKYYSNESIDIINTVTNSIQVIIT